MAIILFDIEKKTNSAIKIDSLIFSKGPIFIKEKENIIDYIKIEMLAINGSKKYEKWNLIFEAKEQITPSKLTSFGIFKEVKTYD